MTRYLFFNFSSRLGSIRTFPVTAGLDKKPPEEHNSTFPIAYKEYLNCAPAFVYSLKHTEMKCDARKLLALGNGCF